MCICVSIKCCLQVLDDVIGTYKARYALFFNVEELIAHYFVVVTGDGLMDDNQSGRQFNVELFSESRACACFCFKRYKVQFRLLRIRESLDVILEASARRTPVLGKYIAVILFHHLIKQEYRLCNKNRRYNYLH